MQAPLLAPGFAVLPVARGTEGTPPIHMDTSLSDQQLTSHSGHMQECCPPIRPPWQARRGPRRATAGRPPADHMPLPPEQVRLGRPGSLWPGGGAIPGTQGPKLVTPEGAALAG